MKGKTNLGYKVLLFRKNTGAFDLVVNLRTSLSLPAHVIYIDHMCVVFDTN